MLKNQRPTEVAIQERFFEALELLIASGELRGLKTFCDRYDLNRIKYSHLRAKLKDPGAKRVANYTSIDLAALTYICRDFRIKPGWLLLGKGGMR